MNQVSVVLHKDQAAVELQNMIGQSSIVPFKVEGKGMEPSILEGAYVGIDVEDKEICSGSIYAVNLCNGGLELRRLFMGYESAIFRADNPNFADITIPIDEFNSDLIAGQGKWVIQAL